MTARMSAHEFLVAEFERRVRANARYSLRAFARDLGKSPGEVSELLSGKRRLTPKAVTQVAARLGLSAKETQELLGLAALEASGIEAAPARSRELGMELFGVVSDWYCFAVLNLFDTADFRADAQWIGRRLGITAAEAKLAIERLERVGLLHRDERGRLERDPSFVMSPSGIPSEAIRNHHRSILAKAIQALETQPVSERDITGLGLAIDPKDLPEIVGEIRKFRDRIATKYSRGRRTEVYCLETAFFRLTEKGGSRK